MKKYKPNTVKKDKPDTVKKDSPDTMKKDKPDTMKKDKSDTKNSAGNMVNNNESHCKKAIDNIETILKNFCVKDLRMKNLVRKD